MSRKDLHVPIHNGKPRKLTRAMTAKAPPVNLSKRTEITIVLRPRGSDEQWWLQYAEATTGPPSKRRYLTRDEFRRTWGAKAEDLEAVRKFGRAHGLEPVSSDPFRRCVVFSGTLRQISRAFRIELVGVAHPRGTYHSYHDTPRVWESIHPSIEAIVGLDNLPSAHPHLVLPAPESSKGMDRDALLAAYRFPRGLDGKGQSIAIIELGGGFYLKDYRRYFEDLGLRPPPLRVKRVRGTKNSPAKPADIRKYWDAMTTGTHNPCVPVAFTGNFETDLQVAWTTETSMDIELAGTLAPGASIFLLQGTDDDQGQYHTVSMAIADRKSAASVLSCSWGTCEDRTTPSLMPALDRWFQSAAILGMTVCFSCGDLGDRTCCEKPGQKKCKVEFPSSSPYVLAVGGTTLDPKKKTEIAWSQNVAGLPFSGGGGFSNAFPLPPWQVSAKIDPKDWIPDDFSSGKGRALPDVAAKADFDNAFSILVGGDEVAAGGTSAACPTWGALITVINEGLRSPAGSLNTLLYEGGLSGALRDVDQGNTGTFHAKPGWDPCTGWGTPNGEALLRALKRGA